MKSRCRLFVLALLVLSGTIETGAEIERLKPFPAYYPSPADQAAAQRALRSAAEHLAGGHFGEAEQAVREAARLLPTAAVPFVMLGMIAEQQGRTTEAIEFYREALAWEPNESQALSALERLGAPSYENPVSQYEDQLVQLINAERRTAGLPTLKPHPVLAEVARAFSASMRDEGFFAHRSPLPGQTTALDRFLRRFDGRPQRLGENISRRWTRPQPALNSENILLSHAELMMSSRHRFNILKADFIYVGVGIATNEMGDYWITQLFMTPRPTKESVMVIPPAEGH